MQQVDVATRPLLGGSACLDFANSVDWASDGTERPSHADALTTPEDLARLGERLGARKSRAPLVVSGRELRAALALRQAIHTVFADIAAKAKPDPAALAELHTAYQEAVEESHLVTRNGLWMLEWAAQDQRSIRFAVAVDAFELLNDPDRLRRVRVCPGNNCGWLFIDTSGRRRWCSMQVCGSRAKMRRLYERQRQARGTAPAEGSSPRTKQAAPARS
jgi:predicted RNA-binding Zn ribbon-like protein